MVELPLASNEEEMLQMLAKGKLDMVSWIKSHYDKIKSDMNLSKQSIVNLTNYN